jgi:hypothetical protein
MHEVYNILISPATDFRESLQDEHEITDDKICREVAVEYRMWTDRQMEGTNYQMRG